MTVKTVSTRVLSWHPAERRFTGELSDVAAAGAITVTTGPERFGLRTVSHVTGDYADWVVAAVHRDREGDVTHYTLRPTTDTLHRLPALAGATMTLFND